MKKHIGACIRIVLFIAIFAAIMRIMNFFLVPSNWASIDRWEQYSEKDDVDTLFVGSSVGWVVVPRVIDENNHCQSVNMSTPNQFYKTSCEAAKFISRQQPLKTVVLLTGFEGLESAEDYGAAEAFLKAQYETAGIMQREGAVFSQKIGRYADTSFLKSTDSMNIWFDWVESSTYSLPEIVKNIAYRRSRQDKSYTLDLNERIDRINPPFTTLSSVSADMNAIEKLNLSNITVDERSLKKLDEMASYLTSNNIRFVVILTPHRSDMAEDYGDEYDIIDSYLEEFVTIRGGEYYNIDKDPELRAQLPDEMFTDREHIDDHGNNIVSMKIAQLLRKD